MMKKLGTYKSLAAELSYIYPFIRVLIASSRVLFSFGADNIAQVA